MPILNASTLTRYTPPEKTPHRLRILDSHEFVELYRGDKDLRVGKMLVNQYGCEFVQLGTNIASPADAWVFKQLSYPAHVLGSLPDDYYLLLMKSKMVYHRKGSVGSLGGYFRWTPGIIREVCRWKPDVIFENPFLTLTPRSYQTYVAARLLNIPIVYFDSGDILPTIKLKHRLVLPFERPVAHHASRIITYNAAGKQRFMAKYGYPAHRIEVIPKPIDTDTFHPHCNHDDFTRKYNLQGKFVVAYFGRLCAKKGADTLLDAAALMRDRGSDRNTVFLFVGGNIEKQSEATLRKRLEHLDLSTVRLTGMVPHDEMPNAYAGVDVAVFPDATNNPSFTTVLAESMASGLPIIIGNRGWESATPIVDGENGFVVEPRDPRAIADHIELLQKSRNLYHRLGTCVRQFAVEHMAYDKVVRRYYQILADLAGQRGTTDYDRDELRQPARTAAP